MENIKKRRSIRKFNEKKITIEKLEKLVEAGFCAPSARNQSSRVFIIIDDKKIIDNLANVSQGALVLKNAQAAIAVVGEDPSLLTAPLMASADLAASTQNILLAATSEKIGSCWIGIYPVEDRMHNANDILGIKGNRYVYSLIALGYLQDEEAFYYRNKIEPEKIYYNKVK